MRRCATAFAVLAALVFSAAPCLAAYPTPTKLRVATSEFWGMTQYVEGATDPWQLVEVRFLTPRLKVKAYGRKIANADGSFGLSFPQRLGPGDSLEVTLGGNPGWAYRMVYSHVQLTALDSAAGTISGLVTPRRPRVMCQVTGSRVIPDPANVAEEIGVSWQTPASGKPTDAAGRFRVKPTLVGLGWEGTYRRGDRVRTWYEAYPVAGNSAFVLTAEFVDPVPGLQVAIGADYAVLGGPPGRNYAVTLLAPGGTAKALTYATAGSLFPYVVFHKANGAPVAIASGDTLRVAGFGGFTTPVPRFAGAMVPNSDTVRVVGPPLSRIRVSYALYDDAGAEIHPHIAPTWVKTDAAGKATAAPAADLRVGDRATLQLWDDRGNRWLKEVQGLPSP